MSARVIQGDCLAGLEMLASESAHALVTDPPAGISLLGKDWDGDKGGRDQWVAWLCEVMAEALRALKPGAHGLVWALPRTAHWTATALEDAGFEVRDVVVHCFGTGMPKSFDVSKAMDKKRDDRDRALEDAVRWKGWGTCLKPAGEHWILVRKPFAGTVADCVRLHGTGALNIDACRIEMSAEDRQFIEKRCRPNTRGAKSEGGDSTCKRAERQVNVHDAGRWPTNLVLDPEAVEAMEAQEAGASRFFYCAKPGGRERPAWNTHPTVKPIDLMRYLVRMVKPPGGLVLDPFAGSGTTAIACIREGFDFVGFEREAEYVQIIRRRIAEELFG